MDEDPHLTDLILTPYVFEESDCHDGSDSLNLHMWCYDDKSRMNLCKITNFPVHECVELSTVSYHREIPDGGELKDSVYYENDVPIVWDPALASRLFSRICGHLKGKQKSVPVRYEFNEFYSIYYYTRRKNPYMYFFFNCLKDRQDFRNECTKFHFFLNKEYEYVKLTTHEAKVDSYMRLMANAKLKYASWFEAKGVSVPLSSPYRISNENVLEYYLNWQTMKPHNGSYYIRPRILAYDLEVYGHRGTKRFVDAATVKDAVFMISVDFKLFETKDSRFRVCFVYGETEVLRDAIPIRFKTEADMIVGFLMYINWVDADIVMGYNNHAFDAPYLISRLEINGIPESHIPNTGRLLKGKTDIYSRTWKSSGRGNNTFVFPIRNGRMEMDCLNLVRMCYQLRMYTLEFTSQKWLKTGKDKVTVAEMFDAFESYHRATTVHGREQGIQKMTKIANYCVRDSVLATDLFEKLLMWYHVRSLSDVSGVSMSSIILNGEQVRCYSQLFIQCTMKGYVLSNTKKSDMYYSGGFVGKPVPKRYPIVFTLDFNSLYPSIIQAYNLCWTTFVPVSHWKNIPVEDCEVIRVMQMEPRVHFSLDRKRDIETKIKLYKSGYSVEITNEEYEYIRAEKYVTNTSQNPDNDEIPEADPELHEGDALVERWYEFRFVKRSIMEGFLPELEREWVGARKVVKNKIKDLEKAHKRMEDRRAEIVGVADRTDLDDVVLKAETVLEEKSRTQNEIEERKDALEDEITNFGESTPEELRTEFREIQTQNTRLVNEIEKLLEEYNGLLELRDAQSDPDKLRESLDRINERIDAIRVEINSNDRKQNAIKIIANSGYGFTGVREGMLSGLFIAICVTYLGRKLIGEANDVLVSKFVHLGATIVYNDTDSSMVGITGTHEDVLSGKLNLEKIGKDMEVAICGRPELKDRNGTVIEDAIPAVFKAPLKMEMEDCCLMVPIKPKFYLKLILNKNPDVIKKEGIYKLEDGQPVIKRKGVLTAKRGNSKFAGKIYDELSQSVLFGKEMIRALQELTKEIVALLKDEYSPTYLEKIITIGADVSEKYFSAKFANNLAKAGKPTRPGDKIRFVVVKPKGTITVNEDGEKLDSSIGNRCRDVELYEDDPKRDPIDHEYYVKDGIQTQFDELFNVAYHDIVSVPEFKNVGYKPRFSRCHFVHFSHPVKMLVAMVKDYLDSSDEAFGDYLSLEFDAEYDSTQPRNHYVAEIVRFEMERICEYVNTASKA
jgi:DNA polymerase elongation subunit (family B)